MFKIRLDTQNETQNSKNHISVLIEKYCDIWWMKAIVILLTILAVIVSMLGLILTIWYSEDLKAKISAKTYNYVESADFWYRKGINEEKMGEYDKALESLNAAHALDPTNKNITDKINEIKFNKSKNRNFE